MSVKAVQVLGFDRTRLVDRIQALQAAWEARLVEVAAPALEFLASAFPEPGRPEEPAEARFQKSPAYQEFGKAHWWLVQLGSEAQAIQARSKQLRNLLVLL